MTDMTPDESLENPADSKPIMPLSRILLILVLLIGIVMLFLDRGARSSADTALFELQMLIDSGDKDRTPDIVQQLVGKTPNEDPGYELSIFEVEVYSWRGARTYTVHAGYRKGKHLLLEKVSMNKPLTDKDE